MAKTLLTPDQITAEALTILKNNLVFVGQVDKQHDKETTIGGQKTGGTIKIRQPIQYTVRDGWPINAQDPVEEYETLTIGTIKGVDINFTESELALDLNSFSKQFLEPAMIRLATEIDLLAFQQAYKGVYNSVGTPGTTPATAQVYLDAGTKLSNFACPTAGRKCIINPAAQGATVGALLPLFNAQGAISDMFKTGQIGKNILGFDFFVSQNVPNHTCGSRSGTTLIDEDSGTNLVEGSEAVDIDGLGGATQTLAAGDVFTVSSVYGVNPVQKQALPDLQQFVAVNAETGSGSQFTADFKPYTRSTGARKTVDALMVNGATVTFTGTASTAYPQNLAFNPEFYTFATANLEMPSDVSFKAQKSLDGINMRILRQFDINNSNHPCRIDIFWGGLVQRPAYACRIWG